MNKVTKITSDFIEFDDETKLYSDHEQDCCENHYLDFSYIKLEDFQGLEFDLTGDFFERITDYGIMLKPIKGFPIRIPGYGYNNGWYSSELTLVLQNKQGEKRFDISDCQVITD